MMKYSRSIYLFITFVFIAIYLYSKFILTIINTQSISLEVKRQNIRNSVLAFELITAEYLDDATKKELKIISSTINNNPEKFTLNHPFESILKKIKVDNRNSYNQIFIAETNLNYACFEWGALYEALKKSKEDPLNKIIIMIQPAINYVSVIVLLLGIVMLFYRNENYH